MQSLINVFILYINNILKKCGNININKTLTDAPICYMCNPGHNYHGFEVSFSAAQSFIGTCRMRGPRTPYPIPGVPGTRRGSGTLAPDSQRSPTTDPEEKQKRVNKRCLSDVPFFGLCKKEERQLCFFNCTERNLINKKRKLVLTQCTMVLIFNFTINFVVLIVIKMCNY